MSERSAGTTVGLAAGGALLVVVVLAAGAAAGLATLAGLGSGPAPSAAAARAIPPAYLALYRQAAATCPGLSWTVLAAIGTVESDNGQSTLPGVTSGVNRAGIASGPMQFEQATFAAYALPVPPGGANPPSPYDPTDAIYAAARDLCANGARGGANVAGAVFAYNHASWYVAEVLALASTYAATSTPGGPTLAGTASGSQAAATALDYAQGQLGIPYQWGGNGPAAGDAGFDCSGLTQAAYAAAGIHLPRVAQAQYDAGPQVPAGVPLQPGDLVFFGTGPASIAHVGIYVGQGQMIDAPHTGAVVRIEPAGWSDYVGATRPAT